MKVIIAGGRRFYDYDLLKRKCDYFLRDKKGVEIVSGNAKGADELGERYAKEMVYPIKLFKADWKLGRFAGFLRNREMANYADALIAFWDGKSRGTKNMIEEAKEKGLLIRIVKYK